MSIFDKAKDALDSNKDKIADAVDKHGDKIDQGIDRASQEVNRRTGGRFEKQVDQGAEKLRDGLDSLDGKQDDLGAHRTGGKPEPDPGS